ncbi:MAG: transcriptional regulator [Desulfuromonas sp.]|nr:MAG: transcriptional regulator [Desulfuromonas sp.]
MKQIQAYIKKHKLDDVVRGLRKSELLSGLSVMDREGYGLGWARGGSEEHELLVGVKLEVFCPDINVDQVVSIIEKEAHTGLKGDGKIYVSHVDQAVRISTGERGEEAV